MTALTIFTTFLKGFTALWALITVGISSALVHKFNDLLRPYVRASGFSQGNAVIAAGALSFLYFAIAVVLIFAAPRSVLLSMIADVICLSVILLLSLGSMAALTDVNAAFRGCRGDIVFCALGNTTLAVGWCLVVLILIILSLEVIVTLRRYGGSLSTWRTPFNELVNHGPSDAGHSKESRRNDDAQMSGSDAGMVGGGRPEMVQRV